MERKPFAMFFNGSPRKNWNTAKVLQSAMKGAEAAGAETELVNLYELKFFGCKSCFACKIKNSQTDGVCAIRDELRPVLERARKPARTISPRHEKQVVSSDGRERSRPPLAS